MGNDNTKKLPLSVNYKFKKREKKMYLLFLNSDFEVENKEWILQV